ncbi:MAG: helix-turn-helix transcriptional regulator [Catenulispora sp.]|nr:helix-turn-helix transcriptional regulator [Catenulispora sp.]
MTSLRGNSAIPLDASVDALSDVLDFIHLQGETLTSVRMADGGVISHGSGERSIHVVQQGPVDLEVAGDGTRPLAAGDLALLATGAGHRLGSAGGGEWMTGTFLVEESTAAPLLAVLPPVIVIRGSETRFARLPLCTDLLAAELADPSAGSRVMVSRLLELLFILALRAWSVLDTAPQPGWLPAALDRALGPVLTAVHRRPEQDWSVEDLAALASMSRAAFAARFVRLVGEPPGRYLARLRLARAAELLQSSSEPVGSIGKAVGYSSEAAFSRAFAREYGAAPREWRAKGQRA